MNLAMIPTGATQRSAASQSHACRLNVVDQLCTDSTHSSSHRSPVNCTHVTAKFDPTGWNPGIDREQQSVRHLERWTAKHLVLLVMCGRYTTIISD